MNDGRYGPLDCGPTVCVRICESLFVSICSLVACERSPQPSVKQIDMLPES